MSEEKREIIVPLDLKMARAFAKGLSSVTRLTILSLLHNGGSFSISELAERVGQTEANLSAQVGELEKLKLVKAKYAAGRHGIQKRVSLLCKKVIFQLVRPEEREESESGTPEEDQMAQDEQASTLPP